MYNVFEAVDVITLIKGGFYDDLSRPVGEALKKRSPVSASNVFLLPDELDLTPQLGLPRHILLFGR